MKFFENSDFFEFVKKKFAKIFGWKNYSKK